MTTRALKKVQYGYHGKNGKVSDYTERTLCEIDSSNSLIGDWDQKQALKCKLSSIYWKGYPSQKMAR